MFPKLLTHTCVLCDQQTPLPTGICQACIDELPKNTHACLGCAIPLTSKESALCGHCVKIPPPWHSIYSPYLYQAQIQWLIQEFKYNKSFRHGNAIRCLMSHVPRINLESIDMMIPIPLHINRLIHRGFNQSLYMSKAFQLPIRTDVLYRNKTTAPLAAGLKKKDRMQQMHDAFTIRKSVKDQHILLLDDVMTTGATLEAASNALLCAGAKHIDIYVFARTAID